MSDLLVKIIRWNVVEFSCAGINTMGTPGMNTTGAPGMHSTGPGTGMGGGYVQPPQNISQTTGLTPGAGTGAGIGQQHIPVVGQQYVAQTVRSYAVSKKKLSVSKGDWTITDQVGHSSFEVDGRIASMRDKRFLRDAAGNKILTMKKKVESTPAILDQICR